uniref:Uncharacterized protein n=1 Tax=Opuntia streptacantha TaxID=393608 RepID=A0A7C9ELR5_OPUST
MLITTITSKMIQKVKTLLKCPMHHMMDIWHMILLAWQWRRCLTMYTLSGKGLLVKWQPQGSINGFWQTIMQCILAHCLSCVMDGKHSFQPELRPLLLQLLFHMEFYCLAL